MNSGISQEQFDALRDSVITMATESWRLFKFLERIQNSLDAKEQQRYQSKVRWFSKKVTETLEAAGLKIVDCEGQIYDPGIPATPLNLEDFQDEDNLHIIQMLEPIIIDYDGKIVKTGAILLGRTDK